MKPLKPNGCIDLEHRAYFLHGALENSIVVAASADGHVSWIDLAGNTVQLLRPTERLRSLSPHPFQSQFAFVDGFSGALMVQKVDGTQIAHVDPPSLAENASGSVQQGFVDCYFDLTGDYLWLVAPRSQDECELSLVATKSWSVVHKQFVKDEFGASFCSFHATGRRDLVSLWMAAGQDGQRIYWLKRNESGFSVKRAEALANCAPPVFSPDATELLVVTEKLELCRYVFPSMKQLGSPLESGDEDNPFAESLCYLDHQHALAGTGEGRVFLIDTKKMKIMDEVAIEGHEPRPIGEYYPILAKEDGLATDLTWFTKLGNTVVFEFRRDREAGLLGWKYSLLWYSMTT